MSQRGRSGGLIAAIFAFCLVMVGSTLVILRVGDITGLLGAPQPQWRAGDAPGAVAVLPAASTAPAPAAAAVAATLQPLLADPALGANVTAAVIDVATGQLLAGRNPDGLTVPASAIKLVTAASALATLGPIHRFRTRVVTGAEAGEVVLIGGGDPTLAAGSAASYPDAARLTALAAQAKEALGDIRPTRVTFDASIFSGPVYGPWDADISDTRTVVSAITGLMVDAGRTDPSKKQVRRVAEPDVSAAQAFAALLGLPASAVTRGSAPAGARELGAVQSPPLLRLVEVMLTDSDNVIAESLARHVAIARQQAPTYEGGAAAQRAAIGELGLPIAELQMTDGSGLSRGNKVSPSLLAELVALATRTDRPALRGVLTGLPVGGYNGTLTFRFEKPTAGASAAGSVRLKTGTLRSVSSVAGVVTTADGRTLAVAVLADAVAVTGTPQAQDALDRIAAALAACGCR